MLSCHSGFQTLVKEIFRCHWHTLQSLSTSTNDENSAWCVKKCSVYTRYNHVSFLWKSDCFQNEVLTLEAKVGYKEFCIISTTKHVYWWKQASSQWWYCWTHETSYHYLAVKYSLYFPDFECEAVFSTFFAVKTTSWNWLVVTLEMRVGLFKTEPGYFTINKMTNGLPLWINNFLYDFCCCHVWGLLKKR